LLFAERLEDHRNAVEGHLTYLLNQSGDGPPASGRLARAMRYATLGGGELIEFSVDAGAIPRRALAIERVALRVYARHIRRTFQVADDLPEAESSAVEVGKATGKDAGAGKVALVSLLGSTEARSDTIDALRPFGSRAAILEEAAHFVTHRRT
jgi:farnesyl diphosphate synthase